jgi:hypothetical protein
LAVRVVGRIGWEVKTEAGGVKRRKTHRKINKHRPLADLTHNAYRPITSGCPIAFFSLRRKMRMAAWAEFFT